MGGHPVSLRRSSNPHLARAATPRGWNRNIAASAKRSAPLHELAALHSEKAPTDRAMSKATIIPLNGAILAITARNDSLSQRADDHLCRFGSGEVLLTGDEVAVANGKPAPQSRAHVIGTEALHLVLDSPGHDVF